MRICSGCEIRTQKRLTLKPRDLRVVERGEAEEREEDAEVDILRLKRSTLDKIWTCFDDIHVDAQLAYRNDAVVERQKAETARVGALLKARERVEANLTEEATALIAALDDAAAMNEAAHEALVVVAAPGGVEQSKPLHLPSQAHVPSLHTPWPPQSKGHRRHAHSGPLQPGAQ